MRVADRGVGCEPAQIRDRHGLGLISIEERVKLLRGTFSLQSALGKGTELKVQIPFQQPVYTGD
ncbi:MAG: hypothetical protein ACRENP_08290 [Longimicrobiales bacterium]